MHRKLNLWVALVATLLVISGTSSARADVMMTFQTTSPAEGLAFSAGPHMFGTMPTGTMQFTAGAGAAENGFGSSVRTYCAQIFVDVDHSAAGSVYSVVPLASLTDLQNPPSGSAALDPVNKAKYITELWGRYESLTTDNVNAGAFALAIWKLLYDPLSGRSDFSSGYIQFTGAAALDPSVLLASRWLSTLSGDTTQFTANPLYANQEIVGLASSQYQDQIAIRTANPVPAPAGLALFLFGGLTLAGRRAVRKS